jgi:hypothetical protein
LFTIEIAFASKNLKQPFYARTTIIRQKNMDLTLLGGFGRFQFFFKTLPKGFNKLKNTSFLQNKKTHNTSQKSIPPFRPPNVAKTNFKNINVEIVI